MTCKPNSGFFNNTTGAKANEYAHVIRSLPEEPNRLLQNGWKETSHPAAVSKGHRTFVDSQSGLTVRFDKGVPGQPGNRGKDHYHVFNPNSNRGKHDKYLDKNGNPVSYGSDDSHIYPGDLK